MATKAKTASPAAKRAKAKAATPARNPVPTKSAAAPKAAAPAQTAPAAKSPVAPATAPTAPVEPAPAETAAAGTVTAAVESAQVEPGQASATAVAAVETAAVETAATIETTARAATDATVEKVDQAVDLVARQADEAIAATGKGLDDATKAGEATIETLLATGTTLAKGFEQMNGSILDYAQSAFSANLATVQQIMACASVREAMDIQLRHMQTSLDGLLAEGSKVSGIASATLSHVWTPFGEQLKAGLERAWTPLAA